MADINPKFSLYHRTLKYPSSGLCSIIGNFSGSKKSQEIVRATQTTLELWKFNKSTAEISRIVVQNAFCNVREIASFRLIETNKDLIIITSDAGSLSIVEFDPINLNFSPVKNMDHYKTGVRRLAPGEYISVDPRGRAAMLCAIERNKIVYPLTRDNSDTDDLIVLSPIEANRNNVLTYCITAMDIGFENPLFAAIETDYTDPNLRDKKLLNYYEYDLGLNHVILKETEYIGYSSNHLVSIPGGLDGPSGILLCSKGMLQYKFPFKPTHYLPIPQRKGSSKSVVVNSVVHKMKDDFFILIQNQYGDIFKVTLEYMTTQETRYDVIGKDTGPGMVTSIKTRYFDTIPVCKSFLVLKSGYLYADTEEGDQYLYQFEKLATEETEKEWKSEDYPDEQSVFEEELESLSFNLKDYDNINLVGINTNLNPMMDIKLNPGNMISSLPELYSLTGSGARSSVKVLHKNITLSEVVTQELPSKIINAFTCKIHKSDEFDKYIILSFFDGSIILSIGEEVEEAENSGFIDTVTTLDVHQIGEDSIVQIHATGIKQIFYSNEDEPVKSVDWNPPAGIEIIHSACTNTQVAVALSNGDAVYFETSQSSDALVEYSVHKEFNAVITSIAMGDIPIGRIRSPFIVVTCKDSSIHVLSTDPKHSLDTKFSTKLYGVASSVAITSHVEKTDEDGDGDYEEQKEITLGRSNQLLTFVHVGLQNGVYVRYLLTDDGELTKGNKKFIMASPLNIIPIRVTNKAGDSVTLATIHSLLSFFVVPDSHDDIKFIPLPIAEKFVDTENEDGEEEVTYSKVYGCIVSLHSEDVPQGLILAHGDKLTIASVPLFNIVEQKTNVDCQTCIINKLKTLENIESIPLRYTPRHICDSDEYKMAYIACSDVNVTSIFNKLEHVTESGESDEIITYGNIDDDYIKKFEDAQHFKYQESDISSSCIHVFSTENLAIGQTIELLGNQTAYRLGIATLEHNGTVGDFLLVSTIVSFNPSMGNVKSYEKCYIRVYHIEEDGSLSFIYKHEFPNPVLAIHPFQGRVLLGCGNELDIYELGKRQLLRKTGLKMDDYGVHNIVDIKSSGFRVFVSDIRSSVHLVLYQTNTNTLVPLVDDTINRHITRSHVLDHDTVIVGDKFGTLSVLRNPKSDLEIEHGDPGTIKHIKWKDKIKFEVLMNFYVGDVITGIVCGQLGIGGEKVVLYGGINGTIGVLNALKSIKEVNFFRELEKLMRNVLQGLKIGDYEHESKDEGNSLMIVGRDLLKYRSYYVPKKSCIDGDVIEEYFNLSDKKKVEIAELLDMTINQIEERIIEIKNRSGY